MDLTSALSKYASRKQLRRVAASLGLQADEAGSLDSLLGLDRSHVLSAIKSSFKNAKECAMLESAIEEWIANGPPKEIVEESAAGDPEETILATPVVSRAEPDAAPPKCCVECHSRTPFVFRLLDCRLCESCERTSAKYTLMTFAAARSLHGLAASDLRGLQSMGKGDQRFFLRSDVERCAIRKHGSARAELAALKKESSREWKENSFSTDHRGKTHKWKEWNSTTYQRKQVLRKQDPGSVDDAAFDCMNLSALVYTD